MLKNGRCGRRGSFGVERYLGMRGSFGRLHAKKT